jgi:hypothetical protein
MELFTNEKKLMAGSESQLLLNYCQELFFFFGKELFTYNLCQFTF